MQNIFLFCIPTSADKPPSGASVFQANAGTLTAHSPPVSSTQTRHTLYRYGYPASGQNGSDDAKYLHNTPQTADRYDAAE
ncbi:hypothetical protein [Xenorhabdus nematophila]|uniref:hypothetical protein n=1 Tax=Xenorhabdus nematophila TaxID=628 RepID=UPI00190F85DE|nr:hypothetical protein [Xenorhabdus nematophila]